MDARRISIIALAVLAITAIAATLIVMLLDTDRYRVRVEEIVSDRLNATLHINGPLTLHWFPRPGATAEQVVLEQQGAEIGKAEQARVTLEWFSLLRGAPAVHAVHLTAPDLTIRRARNGDLSLTGQSGRKGEGKGNAITLQTVEIERGRLAFTQQTEGVSRTLTAENADVMLHNLRMEPGETPLPARLALEGDVSIETLRFDELVAQNIRASLHAADGVVVVSDVTGALFEGETEIHFEADYNTDSPTFSATASVTSLSLEAFLQQLSPGQQASGQLNFSAHARTQGTGLDNWLQHLNGELTLRGESLVLQGMDIDRELSRYQSTQRFNLVDLGALAFAGPVGIAATKGAEFARLFDRSDGETHIRTMVSTWAINDGIAHAEDAAFATEKNRLAMLGDLDLGARRFSDAEVAVIDRRGCAIMRQGISGPFAEPRVQSVNYVKTLLGAPLDLLRQGLSLVDGDEDCEPVYMGSVAAP